VTGYSRRKFLAVAGGTLAGTLSTSRTRRSSVTPRTTTVSRALGRKLLPKDNPASPNDQFAWLVRSIRACHHNADVRDTATFSKLLGRDSVETLKPASINRLETGALDFTLERCVAYERALGLEENKLADAYLWILRNSAMVPKTSLSRLREPQAEDFDLFWRLATDHSLKPLEWLRLACLYSNRPGLFSPRVRSALFERAVAALANSAEGDQRIMREVLVRIGEDVVPLIYESVVRSPIRNFVAVEALGYMEGEASWRTLLRLQESLLNSWTIHSVIESIHRRMWADHALRLEAESETRVLTGVAVSALQDTDELFMAREACLELVHRVKGRLTARQRSSLGSIRQDLVQLSVMPTSFHRGEVVRVVVDRFGELMAAERPSEQVPTRLPGLSTLIEQAVFGRTRQDRIALGVLLSPWAHVDQLARSVGGAMLLVPPEDYGTQRSMVRFATKLNCESFQVHIRELARSGGTRDEGTNLSLAWAMGLARDNTEGDESILNQMYQRAESVNTKRAICIAASRRNFKSLLRAMAQDRDSNVSREARLGAGLK